LFVVGRRLCCFWDEFVFSLLLCVLVGTTTTEERRYGRSVGFGFFLVLKVGDHVPEYAMFGIVDEQLEERL
jgi:hypothetical protein